MGALSAHGDIGRTYYGVVSINYSKICMGMWLVSRICKFVAVSDLVGGCHPLKMSKKCNTGRAVPPSVYVIIVMQLN